MTTRATLAAVMDPSRREHFVYRAYDATGVLLYIGCTNNLTRRWTEHRLDSGWADLAVRFRLSGPYSYSRARQIERTEFLRDTPPYGANSPQRQAISRKNRKLRAALVKRYLAEGMRPVDAIYRAVDEAAAAIPVPGLREPCYRQAVDAA